MPKSFAIIGSRLAGRNSLVTSVNIATIRAITPGHPDRVRVGADVSVSTGTDVVLVILSP
jgi:hypothetical protein